MPNGDRVRGVPGAVVRRTIVTSASQQYVPFAALASDDRVGWLSSDLSHQWFSMATATLRGVARDVAYPNKTSHDANAITNVATHGDELYRQLRLTPFASLGSAHNDHQNQASPSSHSMGVRLWLRHRPVHLIAHQGGR